ncbi:MAG: lysine--tRNA ligase [Gammaproteobacteria bacterium RIFCSPLOWO2_02_FULL_61_13]|nr:MAG: lysine--tRNA ligase [Gammaproteobacteria bacterium RIFCSPLOWO2_02_FULL_61_13]
MSETPDSDLIAARRAHLDELRRAGKAYPNDFRRDALAGDLHGRYGGMDAAQLEAAKVTVRVAGRMMSRRVMGKAAFAHIQDMSGQRVQVYLRTDAVSEEVYADFKHWDIGDIVGAVGYLFKSKTGELSVHVDEVRMLAKCLRPLPEKFHGLADQETRYRQRYLDLIMNEEARALFKLRSKVVDAVRAYLQGCGFLEVETPMMHGIPGGAVARPFITHHNTLDMDMYLRIAPELYLKRLVVGGFEKVFEINRSFRNEGLSTRHNPEFTMLEFYQAYADYQDLMNLTEDMMRKLVQDLCGSLVLEREGGRYDFSRPFRRLTVLESILEQNPGLARAELSELNGVRRIAERLQIPIEKSFGIGKIQTEIFEKTVESSLMDPTFITQFPTEVSPLARRNDQDPMVTDRFEFFVGGREVANGFSELNDPDDQAERFRQQMTRKDAGDHEAMHFDDDYILALEYGLPPTAGEGIGIDRLVMLLGGVDSIREVILFPHLRPRA